LQDLAQRDVAPLGRMASGHREEAPHDAHATLRGLADALCALAGTLVGRRGLEQRHPSQDDGQRAVELVRYAGEEVAHRRELLRQAHHGGLVVHDQDLGAAERLRDHAVLLPGDGSLCFITRCVTTHRPLPTRAMPENSYGDVAGSLPSFARLQEFTAPADTSE